MKPLDLVTALALLAGCTDGSPAPVVAGPADARVEDVTPVTSPPPSDGGVRDAALDGGAPGGPRILFDPASITLLPDASLELALPPGFDAGR